MEKTGSLEENSEAIQCHLGILQDVIRRMASNSASSKAWCITLASAILVVIADKSKPDYALIALIPIALFLILDAYYLALEKGFRNSYNEFIDKLHGDGVKSSDLYAVVPSGKLVVLLGESLISFSIWLFYLTLFAMVLVTKTYIL